MLHMSGNVARFVNRALISVALVRMMAAAHSASRKTLTALEPMAMIAIGKPLPEYIAQEAKWLMVIYRSKHSGTLCSVTVYHCRS